MSVAALMSPCSFLIFDSIRVILARSTSTKICRECQLCPTYRDVCATHLALGDGPQRLDDRKLGLQTRGTIQESHHSLHHLGGSLLQLAMLL